VQHAHDVTHRVETAVESSFPGTETTVHIEPIEEPAAWEDSALVHLEPELPVTPHETRKLTHR
jgi:divalent metal cation (Fe/Co/Zn/Cd) transporter